MEGYMVVFFTQQNRRYQGKMLGEWIVDVAKETRTLPGRLVSPSCCEGWVLPYFYRPSRG
ncbi:hypothetical protein PspS49_03600 [Pseudomonas sp. S49]|nr:hypothetical protein PspS49_03600 [Pseudomonas sp. S49]